MKKTISLFSVFLLCVFFLGCGGGGGGDEATCQNRATSEAVQPLWIELSPSGTLPDERYLSASAYDATNDKLIMFGGKDGTSFFNDVWVLSKASGASGTPAWTKLAPTGTAPSKRYTAIVGYNSDNNTLVVFGGADSDSIFTDMFRLSNANGSGGAPGWITGAIGGTAPNPARTFMSGVYDESSDTIIFFGGRQCGATSCTLYNETWTIQNATAGIPTWVQLATTGTAPSARVNHSTVYDSENNRLIIFGGNTSTELISSSSSALNDTWVLTNANGTGGTPVWTELNPSTDPDSRYTHSAIYDSVNDRMTVYAGIGTSNSVLPDVWVLTDSLGTPVWVKYDTGSPAPSARAYQNAVLANNNRMIMFGGNIGASTYVNDAWVLKNANGIPDEPVARITIESATTTICETYTNLLVAFGFDADGNEIPGGFFIWSSSDESVATVDAGGLVTAVGEGTAIITATINGISKKITITVKTTSGGGGGGGECSVNTDCSDYCGTTGTWAAGASGASSNGGFCASGSCYCCYAQFGVDPSTGEASGGRCFSCNEVGTNCDADSNVSCYATDDVCLFFY